MKSTIVYKNEPIKAKIIKDFLPSPEELVIDDEKEKVTLTLTKRSVEFFKGVAKKKNASYQAMMRRLLDYYAVNQMM